MRKKIITDIIINSKRSIRQIPIAVEKLPDLEHIKSSRPNWRRKSLNPKFVIWLIAIICILALFFGVSSLFSSVTVVITQKTQKISFNNELFTVKANSSSTGELSFEILKFKESSGIAVEATEEKEVNQKASGSIIIYNNFSSAPQRLINNTRFEANNGKIYRINSSVVVPGLKKVNGEVLPGSIEAVVYADQQGDTYNLKLADLAGDFKIPGFKGDPRYTGFYARLKSDITGGFIGKQLIINDDLRKSTEIVLKDNLKEQLLKELYAVTPDNYLILKDSYSIDYINLPDISSTNNKATIMLEATMNSLVFNNNKLSNYFASKKVADYDGLATVFIPEDNFTATFIAKDTVNLWKNSSVQIKLNGDAIIKWEYDSDSIKKDLLGKKEADIKSILTKYKDSVTSLEVIFKPVWNRYFPDSLNKIRITDTSI